MLTILITINIEAHAPKQKPSSIAIFTEWNSDKLYLQQITIKIIGNPFKVI